MYLSCIMVDNHGILAHITTYSSLIRHGKNIAGNLDSIRFLGKNLGSLIFSRVFLHNTRVRQTFTMRPQFVQNARPRDESIRLVPRM